MKRAGSVPASLTSDLGSEFSNQFRKLLETKGIDPRQKDKDDINAIATIDTAIGNLKKALARDTRKAGTNDWASRLQKVTKGQNALPNEGDYLGGIAPNQVADNDEIRAKLREKNAEYRQLNTERSNKRASKLQEAGQFRKMTSRGGAHTRGFKPRYEGTLRRVEEVKGPRVVDENGNSFLTKFVQPVASATADTGPVRIEQRGSVQTRTRQTGILQPFANRLKRELQGRGAVPGQEVAKLLRNVSTFRAAAAEARLN